MENNEIMVNDEVIEEVTEVVEDSGKGFKVLAIAGLVVLGGVVAFKVGKKVIAKIREAKKEKEAIIEAEFEEVTNDVNSNEEL